MSENKVSTISAVIYTGISIALALAFFTATGGGIYESTARYGGAIWVFILAMIITMPVVIPQVKKRYR
ncbi:MAG: hypothetical protein PHU36_00070 [Syntrophomonadaceae bacterium]|nr:hypothetical protein [Syntrophomonadaceae bacterium]